LSHQKIEGAEQGNIASHETMLGKLVNWPTISMKLVFFSAPDPVRSQKQGSHMTVSSRLAVGFAILRGLQLAVLTVPWLLQKVRHRDATESEKSLVLMVGSRSILLGLALVVLGFSNQREMLGWVLIGDGLLQLFDALHALALRKRTVAVLPAALCVLDALAGITLLG
jgi:hypothetical protein